MDDLMKDLSANSPLNSAQLRPTPAGKLRPILDDGEGDVALWNKEIAKYFRGTRTNSPPAGLTVDRQGLHERAVAVRGGVQVPTARAQTALA